AFVDAEMDSFVAKIVEQAQPGDQILVMSNGGFGGIHGKLLEQLKQKA
ncbi:MAG: UDP-N-acetylmuramate:L-alanyl-gamma-D-glutamyl-meso-diaminopimelate ligase, partial [Pseudomonadota bacterium]